MKRFLLTTAILVLLAFPAAAEAPDVAAGGPLEPQVQNGVHFLSGGLDEREQGELRELSHDYDVRITLTRADGAYLSSVNVVIEDYRETPLVETTTRGPILLAQLEPGRYVIQAASKGRMTERRVVDVPTSGDQVRLYIALVEAPEQTGE